jgi:enoyl-CoA hydratase
MEYKQIIYQPGRVARLILNRPRYLNAQSRIMREEMDDCFTRAMEDEKVGVVVLSGAGTSFSAGHDIGTPDEVVDAQTRGDARDRYGRYKRMRTICLEYCLRWRNLPKPTVAMVHGYCIYGGWMFASSMDVLFASEDALFLPGHTQYFSPPWELGWKKAKELILEHRFLTAWEACQYGFVNRVYPKEKLEQETLALCRKGGGKLVPQSVPCAHGQVFHQPHDGYHGLYRRRGGRLPELLRDAGTGGPRQSAPQRGRLCPDEPGEKEPGAGGTVAGIRPQADENIG